MRFATCPSSLRAVSGPPGKVWRRGTVCGRFRYSDLKEGALSGHCSMGVQRVSDVSGEPGSRVSMWRVGLEEQPRWENALRHDCQVRRWLQRSAVKDL